MKIHRKPSYLVVCLLFLLGCSRPSGQADSKSAEAHNKVGSKLYDQGRYKDAEKELREAIRIKPDHVNAHFNLGLTFIEQEKHADAEKEFREVIRLSPADSEAHFKLGVTLLNQSKAVEAENKYKG